jgi:hypothetical protein
MSLMQQDLSGTKPCVFIQTNAKQRIGSIVAAHALKRNSAHPDAFDVRIMHHRDFDFFARREGQPYLRAGLTRIWRNDDLQSFTPLRFMPPELMGYRGRAVLIDPDVFAIADINELIGRDMQGKAILCRKRGVKGGYASSVMLLDCAKLGHWRVEAQFEEMFAFSRDYMRWVSLLLEPDGTIGLFEPEWNDFDRLTPQTKMLHNTRRKTQPWKTGLPVDFMPVDRVPYFPPWRWVMGARRMVFGDYGLLGRYNPHPDPNQERLFFALLRECLEQGAVTPALLEDEIRHQHLRADAFEMLRRATAPVAPSFAPRPHREPTLSPSP